MRKVATRTHEDDMPAQSFRTLLKELACIIRNMCYLVGADPSEPTFLMTTTPNYRQDRALVLLDAHTGADGMGKMSMAFCVIDEEIQESKRHDLLYKHMDRPYLLSPDNWEKFDKTKNPIHGFVYSVKCLGDIRNKNILDLGCGNGWLSVILA